MTDALKASPEPTAKDLRSFAFTFGAVAALFALFLFWRGRLSPAQIFAIASVAFFAIGLVLPGLLKPFFGPWMKFAEILGYINTRILLGLFFIVGITPTGLMMRISGKDPMGRSFRKKGVQSYWNKPTPHSEGSRHFERQF